MQRILIIEDTSEIADALQQHLQRKGYATSLATRAAQALSLVAAQRPDLIVLDRGLPDRDGYAVLEQLPHIFGAFWQARHADRRGLGLGLSIALGIAEAHGGRLWVESTVGRGSTFVLALPLADGVPPAS